MSSDVYGEIQAKNEKRKRTRKKKSRGKNGEKKRKEKERKKKRRRDSLDPDWSGLSHFEGDFLKF